MANTREDAAFLLLREEFGKYIKVKGFNLKVMVKKIHSLGGMSKPNVTAAVEAAKSKGFLKEPIEFDF